VQPTPISQRNQGIARRLFSALLDLLYPPHCVICGRMGAWLCDACIESIPWLEPPLCQRCGRPISKPGVCRHCQDNVSYLARIRAVSAHLPPLRRAVHALKYEGTRVLADPLGDILAECWRRESMPAEVIVPVPLHRARLRQRGYNQSRLLAEALSKRTGLSMDANALVRGRNTLSQVGLSHKERWDNVWGAFQCTSASLCGCSVLLIDDVCTTGATLEACAAALLEAGAARVWALTLTSALAAQGSKSAIPDKPLDNNRPRRVSLAYH